MTRLMAALTLFVMLAQPALAREKSAREQAGLVGGVRVERLETGKMRKVGKTWAEGPRRLTRVASYDDKGNLVSVVEPYWETGKQSESTEPDEKSVEAGQQKDDAVAPGNRTPKFGGTGVSVYDVRGNLLETAAYGPDGFIISSSVNLYRYDDSGLVLEKSCYVQGKLSDQYRYEYDAVGNKVKESGYRTGKLRYADNYKYDPLSNLTEDTKSNADGSVWHHTDYTYSPGNKLMESVDKFNGNIWVRYLYEYDAKGRKVKESEFMDIRPDETVVQWTVTLFDTHGSPIDRTSTNDLTKEMISHSTFDYQYDPHGNWVKRSESRWDGKAEDGHTEPYEVTYRKISYER